MPQTLFCCSQTAQESGSSLPRTNTAPQPRATSSSFWGLPGATNCTDFYWVFFNPEVPWSEGTTSTKRGQSLFQVLEISQDRTWELVWIFPYAPWGCFEVMISGTTQFLFQWVLTPLEMRSIMYCNGLQVEGIEPRARMAVWTYFQVWHQHFWARTTKSCASPKVLEALLYHWSVSFAHLLMDRHCVTAVLFKGSLFRAGPADRITEHTSKTPAYGGLWYGPWYQNTRREIFECKMKP